MSASPIRGVELDLTLGAGHEHPDLNEKDLFMCLIDDVWHTGHFGRQWYGWSFSGWRFNSAGLQYDKPGTNASRWQRIIKVEVL